jgi:hypothetical protein
MEDSTAFDLNNAIRHWRDGLSHSPQFREEDLAELEAHLRDSVAELQGRGLTDEEAFLLAARRLGNPARLEPEFAKINRGHVWLHRLLWMLVGIQAWGLLTTLSRVTADTVVLGGLAGFGYNSPRAYPLSAGSLFAAALFGLANLVVLAGCVAGCWWLVRRKEDTAHKVALKALHQPVLLGLALSGLVLVIGFSSVVEWPLVQRYYAPEVVGNIATAKSFAHLVLAPLQTLAFVVLTIVLFRRRLRLAAGRLPASRRKAPASHPKAC